MKALFLVNALFLFVGPLFSQDISGTYQWEWDNGRRNFVIHLSPKNVLSGETPSNYRGEHCGVFEHGRRMDCSYEEYSISLERVSENIFMGTILSAYSRTVSKIKITYFPKNQTIRWEVTEHGGGVTYFPRNVTMVKD